MAPMDKPKTVTFNHPFKLNGMTEAFPAGTYELMIDRVALDVSWEAFRTSAAILLKRGGVVSAWPVTQDDLDAAISRDRAHDRKNGFS